MFKLLEGLYKHKGKIKHHAFELFLSIEGIKHAPIKVYSPQINGLYERLNKTIQQECFDIAMRKKMYTNLDELQQDLDGWLDYYNYEGSHSGMYCYGKTSIQTW